MNIVLIGFMCSGKSRVGNLLAKKLGWPHFDTDEMIVKDVGASIADIIRKQGEPAFREIESKAAKVVASLDKTVISTGGGLPLDPENMKVLSERGQLVWLRVSPETVLKRAGNIKSRPLIDPHDPLGSIRSRMAEREKFYARAPYHVDTEGLAASQVVDKILALVPSLTA